MEEIWKPIKEYEGLYEVSNLGNVKSLPKVILTYGGKRTINLSERIMNGTPRSRRDIYPSLGLKKGNKNKMFFIHRLVAHAFILNPKNNSQVNHIDGDKTNNRVDNLEWISPVDNLRHAQKIGVFHKTSKPKIKVNKSNIDIFMSVNNIEQQINNFRVRKRIYKDCTKAEKNIMFKLPEIVASGHSLDEIKNNIEKELITFQNGEQNKLFIVNKYMSCRMVGNGSDREYYSVSIVYRHRFIVQICETIKPPELK
jgi:NUMOD4 motif/HNH endonuclease